jgi:hypothetical protein
MKAWFLPLFWPAVLRVGHECKLFWLLVMWQTPYLVLSELHWYWALQLPWRMRTIIAPFFRWGNQGSERQMNLPKHISWQVPYHPITLLLFKPNKASYSGQSKGWEWPTWSGLRWAAHLSLAQWAPASSDLWCQGCGLLVCLLYSKVSIWQRSQWECSSNSG